MPWAAKQHRAIPKAKENRRSASSKGYDGRWQRLARMALNRDGYLCQECLKTGMLTTLKSRKKDYAVDHIIPAHVRPDLMYALDNLQSLCNRCHGKKSDEDKRKYGANR